MKIMVRLDDDGVYVAVRTLYGSGGAPHPWADYLLEVSKAEWDTWVRLGVRDAPEHPEIQFRIKRHLLPETRVSSRDLPPPAPLRHPAGAAVSTEQVPDLTADGWVQIAGDWRWVGAGEPVYREGGRRNGRASAPCTRKDCGKPLSEHDYGLFCP